MLQCVPCFVLGGRGVGVGKSLCCRLYDDDVTDVAVCTMLCVRGWGKSLCAVGCLMMM